MKEDFIIIRLKYNNVVLTANSFANYNYYQNTTDLIKRVFHSTPKGIGMKKAEYKTYTNETGGKTIRFTFISDRIYSTYNIDDRKCKDGLDLYLYIKNGFNYKLIN